LHAGAVRHEVLVAVRFPKKGWKAFLRALFEDLCDRALLFRDEILAGKSGPGKATYDAIVADHATKPGVLDLYVLGTHIFRIDESEPGRPAGYYWEVVFQLQAKLIRLNGNLISK
jgi:hypothetical protein